MREALALAAGARYRCHPNPQVGCVIVRDGRVVGRGYHQRRGAPHAEIHALREAGAGARGATAYVTLEPCNHYGLTPPCTEALIAAGIGRVVAAMADPDPRTAGGGLERLRSAGVAVAVGVCAAEAAALNRPWLRYQQAGRPYVLIKAAVSLDGKISTAAGESQWITGPAAREEVHELRDQADAILVGIRTVQQDDPQLTARPRQPGPLAFGWGLPDAVRSSPVLPGAVDQPAWSPRHPVRVVLDSMGRTPATARLMPGLIFVTNLAPAPRLKALREAGAEVVELPEDRDGLVPLQPMLAELARRGICSLMVEGGAQVNWSFLHHGVADGARFYIAPRLLGGMQAPGAIGGQGIARLAESVQLAAPVIRYLDADIVIEGDLAYPAAAAPHETSAAAEPARSGLPWRVGGRS